jgi:hypothetical protein
MVNSTLRPSDYGELPVPDEIGETLETGLLVLRRIRFAWRTRMWCLWWVLGVEHDRCWPHK